MPAFECRLWLMTQLFQHSHVFNDTHHFEFVFGITSNKGQFYVQGNLTRG
jgi:hypothetical protein